MKKTNPLSLTAFILVLNLTISAQCKFKKNESDPFTGEKHLVSKNIRLNGDMKSANEDKFFAITNLEMTGKTAKWNFEFYERAIRDKNSAKSIKIKIKTKDGIVELMTNEIPDPKYTIEENAKMTEFDFKFELTLDQLKKLSSGVEIIGIDVFTENKLFKKGSLEDVSQYAKCMLE